MWFEIVDVEKTMRGEIDSAVVLMEGLFLAVVQPDAVLQADYLFIVKKEGANGRVAGIDLLEAIHAMQSFCSTVARGRALKRLRPALARIFTDG